MTDLQHYEQYFKTDESGNLLVRTDFIKELPGLKFGRMKQLFSIMWEDNYNRDYFRLVNSFISGSRLVATTRREFQKNRRYYWNMLMEQKGSCACTICGSEFDATIDHIIPISKNGTNDIQNMQFLCRKHNSEKGAK